MFLNLVFISLISSAICVDLQYQIPNQLCRNDTEFQTITIRENENKTLPEILFIADHMLYYSSDNINWTSKPLPTGFTKYSAFRRNFYNDNSECGKDIPLSFVVIATNSSQSVYNIYDPLNNAWIVPVVNGSWPLFETHYLWPNPSIGFSGAIDVAFIWYNYIVLFIATNTITLELNQTTCDSTTVLNTTVNTWGPFQLRTPEDAFWNGDDLVMVWLLPDLQYAIYRHSFIDDNGTLSTGAECCQQSVMSLFGCVPPNTTTTTDTSDTVSDSEMTSDYESTEDITNTPANDQTIDSESTHSTSSTKSSTSPTTGKQKTPGLSIGLIILLIVILLIVIAIIVAIVFWLKSSKKEDKGIAPVVGEPKPEEKKTEPTIPNVPIAETPKPEAKPLKEDSEKTVRSGLDL